MIIKVLEKNREEIARNMWLMKYINMDKSSHIPFDKFYNPEKVNKITKDTRTEEDIMEDVNSIISAFNKNPQPAAKI